MAPSGSRAASVRRVGNREFQTMLRHAVEKGDVHAAMYLIRAAHISSNEAQGEWVRRVLLAKKRWAADEKDEKALRSSAGETNTAPHNLSPNVDDNDERCDGQMTSSSIGQDETTHQPDESLPALDGKRMYGRAESLSIDDDESAYGPGGLSSELDEDEQQTYGRTTLSSASDDGVTDQRGESSSSSSSRSRLSTQLGPLAQTRFHRMWYDELRPPRMHNSFWLDYVVHWLLRVRGIGSAFGRDHAAHFDSLRRISEDAIERLRQEQLVLFGRKGPPSGNAINGLAPPFAGIQAVRFRSRERSIRGLFDPAVYYYKLDGTQRRMQELLELSQMQWAVKRRRRRKGE